MRKLLKFCLFAAGGLLLLGIAATIGLRMAYPPARLRALVQDQIRKQLNREAQIGPVELGIWGITLERLRLSDVPNFDQGTFLYVEKARIRWALLPLLSHVAVIHEISFDSPQINLVRMADGKTLNISDLQKTAAAPGQAAPTPVSSPAPAKTPASSWSWRIDGIRLKDGAVRFNDRSSMHQTSALTGIDLTLTNTTPTRAQGRLAIARLENPVYTAQDLNAEWALKDIDPTLGHVNGWLRFKQGRGLIQNLNDLVATSKGAKLLFMPVVMLQNLDRLGFVKLGLPDFSRLPIQEIIGDYDFADGTMKIKTFKIVSPELGVDSQGTIQLASGTLAVDVGLNAPKKTLMGEMSLQMHISGTLSNPKTNLDSLKKKAFKATVKNLLEKPDTLKDVNKTLKNIFK